jgi:acyl-coenzyme A thioesterase PaaI-like protein
MPESLKTRIKRWGFNFFPAYRGTGARLTYISDDFHEIHVKLPLSWRTRNYVGTIFGGSMYGAVDPLYMVMLIKILGNKYVVWDKAATIRFKRPGRETLFAEFKITPDEVEAIKQELTRTKSIERVYGIKLVNKAGKVHAEVEKTIYIGNRIPDKEKSFSPTQNVGMPS